MIGYWISFTLIAILIPIGLLSFKIWGEKHFNRTDEQKKSLVVLLKLLHKRYPDAVIQGHRDFSPDRNGNGKIEKNEWIKKCPGFDAKTEYKGI